MNTYYRTCHLSLCAWAIIWCVARAISLRQLVVKERKKWFCSRVTPPLVIRATSVDLHERRDTKPQHVKTKNWIAAKSFDQLIIIHVKLCARVWLYMKKKKKKHHPRLDRFNVGTLEYSKCNNHVCNSRCLGMSLPSHRPLIIIYYLQIRANEIIRFIFDIPCTHTSTQTLKWLYHVMPLAMQNPMRQHQLISRYAHNCWFLQYLKPRCDKCKINN